MGIVDYKKAADDRRPFRTDAVKPRTKSCDGHNETHMDIMYAATDTLYGADVVDVIQHGLCTPLGTWPSSRESMRLPRWPWDR